MFSDVLLCLFTVFCHECLNVLGIQHLEMFSVLPGFALGCSALDLMLLVLVCLWPGQTCMLPYLSRIVNQFTSPKGFENVLHVFTILNVLNVFTVPNEDEGFKIFNMFLIYQLCFMSNVFSLHHV